MTPAQTEVLSRLTDRWQTTGKLGARTDTMRALCREGYAERYTTDGFNVATSVKYRRSTLPKWSERRILDILSGKWPQWTWDCEQGSLIFAIKASAQVDGVVVSFGHNLDCDDLHTDRDVIQAGRIAVAGLRSALGRWGRGK